LNDLKDNCEEILRTTKEWRERESGRYDKPRWTKRDEGKYGKELNEELAKSRRMIEKLEIQGAKIITKIDSVTKLGDTARSNLNFKAAVLQAQLAENVQLFTYATIVFLPLSFCSSLFSMGGSPAGSTIKTFIEVTVVAVVITFLVLVNVKPIHAGYHQLKTQILRLFRLILFKETTSRSANQHTPDDGQQLQRGRSNDEQPTTVSSTLRDHVRQLGLSLLSPFRAPFRKHERDRKGEV